MNMMFWDADACNLHLEMLVMQNGFEPWKLCNAHKILFYFFIWFSLPFFSFVENIDWLSLSRRCDNSCNLILSFLFFFCKSPWGLLQSVCFVWSLENLSDANGAVWHSINRNIDPRVFPFPFKNFDYSAQQENIRLWDRSCAPLKDGNRLSHFGMWPSETFPI